MGLAEDLADAPAGADELALVVAGGAVERVALLPAELKNSAPSAVTALTAWAIGPSWKAASL